MKVIGMQHKSFMTKDKSAEISGYDVFMTEERKNVTGLACEKVFVSDGRIEDYIPKVGDEIKVWYNKFGKVEGIEKAS